MHMRRLGWAGVELASSGEHAVIDPVESLGSLSELLGDPRTPLPPASEGRARVALVTHLHEDHADAGALARALAPDGVVLRPPPASGNGLQTIGTAAAEAALATSGLPTRIVEPWESVTTGPFTITAVPAADGLGDPQVSWVVEAGGTRVLHAGDTLFHGWWWLIKMRCGPVDAAFLPVNGPVADLPHRQPASPLPVTMDADQAAAAAAILEARAAVPIHYDTIHAPAIYEQADDPAGWFAHACASAGIAAHIVEPGQPLRALEAC